MRRTEELRGTHLTVLERCEHRRVLAPQLFHEVRLSYPRRQQYRRLRHAATAIAGSAIAALLGFLAAGTGAVSLAVVLFVAAMALGFSARHWLTIAERSRVGAHSEDEVRRVLAPLRSEGWRLRHSLSWRGRGDIDLVAIATWGVAFAIEVKTSRYEDRSGHGAGAGCVAVAFPAKAVSAQGRAGRVRGSRPRRLSLGGRRASRLDRSPRSRAARDELSNRGHGAAVLDQALVIATRLGEDP